MVWQVHDLSAGTLSVPGLPAWSLSSKSELKTVSTNQEDSTRVVGLVTPGFYTELVHCTGPRVRTAEGEY